MLSRASVRLAFASGSLCARALCAQDASVNAHPPQPGARKPVHPPLAIENVAVIAMDGAPESDRVRRGMTVVIDSGRVQTLGPARDNLTVT